MSIKREKARKLQAKLWKQGKDILNENPSLSVYLGCPNGKKCGLCRYGTFDQDPVKTDRRENRHYLNMIGADWSYRQEDSGSQIAWTMFQRRKF